jgi:phosphohistidine phosphatase
MTMIVYLVRHGIAEDRAPDDAARKLTARGRARAEKAAQGLAESDCRPGLVVSSPFARAKETADIFGQVLRSKTAVASGDFMKPGADPQGCLEFLIAHAASKSIMLVGHMPHLSQLASHLLTGSDAVRADFRKAGVMCLSFPKSIALGTASLEWFLTCGQLRRLR